MCVLTIASRLISGCPLLLIDNREERYARPTAPPRVVVDDGGVAWMGGIDLEAGGTWLGINRHGIVAAIVNRARAAVPQAPRSRGQLCRELLQRVSLDKAVEAAIAELATDRYAGCNVVLLSPSAGYLIESADELRTIELTPGIHTMTNRFLNDPSVDRLQRIRRGLPKADDTSASVDRWIETGTQLHRLHADGDGPAVCLHGDEGGTVSSTVIALTADFRHARYLYAPGPPCTTPFGDYSHELRNLLAGYSVSRSDAERRNEGQG